MLVIGEIQDGVRRVGSFTETMHCIELGPDRERSCEYDHHNETTSIMVNLKISIINKIRRENQTITLKRHQKNGETSV